MQRSFQVVGLGVTATFRQAGAYHTLTGDYLICAVPFSVQKNIEVAPAFSVEKQRAIEQLPYLSASKIFLQSKKRFWVDEGLSGFATTDLPVSQVWDATYAQPGTRGILQAFPISLHSRRVTAMSESERINFALEHVDMIYPGMRNHFEGGVTKCWDEDEWARGASAFMGMYQQVYLDVGAIWLQDPSNRAAIDDWLREFRRVEALIRDVFALSPPDGRRCAETTLESTGLKAASDSYPDSRGHL